MSQDLSLAGISLGAQQQQQQQQDGSERSDTPLLGSVQPEARARGLTSAPPHAAAAGAAQPLGGLRASTASFGYGYGGLSAGGGVRDSVGAGVQGPGLATGASAVMPTPAAVMLGPQAGRAGERGGRPPRSGGGSAGA